MIDERRNRIGKGMTGERGNDCGEETGKRKE